MQLERVLEPVASEREATLAAEAQRMIMAALDHSRAPRISLVEAGQDPQAAPALELSPAMLRAVADLLGLMAQQRPVVLMPQRHELTTQQAAAFLNVSRPHVVKLTDSGALNCRKVGGHRRIAFDDLVSFQAAQRQRSREALRALGELDQELGLY